MCLAVGIQHAMRMGHIVICGQPPSLALHYFSTSHKRHDFRRKKKVTEHRMTKCVFSFPHNFCLKRFSFWEELSEIWPKMNIGLHVRYPLFLSDFNDTWSFSTIFWRILISNFMKIRPVGAELFHEDGRTDVTKLLVIFRNLAPNAPKNICKHYMLKWKPPFYETYILFFWLCEFSP